MYIVVYVLCVKSFVNLSGRNALNFAVGQLDDIAFLRSEFHHVGVFESESGQSNPSAPCNYQSVIT